MRTIQVLKDQGHASVSKLSQDFGVSEVTIRKDLRALEDRSLLVRTHGGAVLIDHYLYDLPFDKQALRHADEKKRIGAAAAARVQDHDTLILAAGSTTVQVARALRGRKNLTVTTNSIHVAHELISNLDVELLMLGGQVRPTTASIVGPSTARMLQEYSFNKLFLSTDGYDIGYGLTTTNMMDAHVNRLMIQSARDVIVVADASKFGRRGLSLICPLEDIDTVITDDRVPDETVKHLEEAGVEVVIV